MLRKLIISSAVVAGVLTSNLCAAADQDAVKVLYAGSLVNVMERSVGPAFEKETGLSFQGYAAGSGKIEINGRTLNEYFTAEKDRKSIFGPLEVTNTGGKMDVWARCNGGGLTGQSGAIVMGLGRALAKFDRNLEVSLRNAGFLTRDSRMKERKKYGQRGARRRFQFSKR